MSSTVKLTSPCAYQGGKQRVSKEIIDYIFNFSGLNINENTQFFDLCCGSGAITVEFINHGINPKNIIMLDVSSWGAFWKAIGDGSFSYDEFLWYANQVPRDKSQIQQYMKDLSLEDANIDECYKYILLQASSFGGKQIWNDNGTWKNTSFRSYWQPTSTSKRKSPVNPMQPMIDTLCDRVKIISEQCVGLKCLHTDIYNVLTHLPKENAIIYIDPPYADTTKYNFDFDLIDVVMKIKCETKIPIFVSEKRQLTGIATKLNFNGAKGGISGVKKCKNEEWLNVFV